MALALSGSARLAAPRAQAVTGAGRGKPPSRLVPRLALSSRPPEPCASRVAGPARRRRAAATRRHATRPREPVRCGWRRRPRRTGRETPLDQPAGDERPSSLLFGGLPIHDAGGVEGSPVVVGVRLDLGAIGRRRLGDGGVGGDAGGGEGGGDWASRVLLHAEDGARDHG